MINVRELSIGSLVMVRHEQNTCSIAEVTELHKVSATVIIRENMFDGIPTNFKEGTEHEVKYEYIGGLAIRDFILQNLGFVLSDKKGWQLMYYYGDMKLLYRHDKKRDYASFRFMSDYQKTFVRISCNQVHRLQNIMRFLTEDMEFKYTSILEKYGTDKRDL